MNSADLEDYVASLREEFADAYAVQRAACEHAVMLMRRLVLAEALLETFTDAPPALLPTETAIPTHESGIGNPESGIPNAAPPAAAPASRAEFPCTEPGCTFVGLNPRALPIHQGRMHKGYDRHGTPRDSASLQKAAAPEKPAPRFPVPERIEWDLPERRQQQQAEPEMPRRAMPRSHNLSGMSL